MSLRYCLTLNFKDMKTFYRTSLPDTVKYNGHTYQCNVGMSGAMNMNDTKPSFIAKELKKEGRYAVLVKVLSKNLKGKTDLYGHAYEPSVWLFTSTH